MPQVLAQCADQLHKVMVQLRDKQEKEIADSLERFFSDSLLIVVEEEDETEALRVLQTSRTRALSTLVNLPKLLLYTSLASSAILKL